MLLSRVVPYALSETVGKHWFLMITACIDGRKHNHFSVFLFPGRIVKQAPFMVSGVKLEGENRGKKRKRALYRFNAIRA